MAVTNFAATPVSSVLIICVLEPLDSREVEELRPMANYFETNLPYMNKSRGSQWVLMPLALWKYRKGDYAAAIQYADRGLAQKPPFPPCEADLHLIRAMACFRTGQVDEACAEYEDGRQPVESILQAGLEHGRADAGYWFDWVYARVLMHEAATVVDCDPPLSAYP
jgi:tetratricopeptide (TPR) repeat protein